MNASYRRLALVAALLLGGNLIIWAMAILAFHHYPLLLGFGAEAFSPGLAHALDADHISAIDNVARKLMQEGKRPDAGRFLLFRRPFDNRHSSFTGYRDDRRSHSVPF